MSGGAPLFELRDADAVEQSVLAAAERRADDRELGFRSLHRRLEDASPSLADELLQQTRQKMRRRERELQHAMQTGRLHQQEPGSTQVMFAEIDRFKLKEQMLLALLQHGQQHGEQVAEGMNNSANVSSGAGPANSARARASSSASSSASASAGARHGHSVRKGKGASGVEAKTISAEQVAAMSAAELSALPEAVREYFISQGVISPLDLAQGSGGAGSGAGDVFAAIDGNDVGSSRVGAGAVASASASASTSTNASASTSASASANAGKSASSASKRKLTSATSELLTTVDVLSDSSSERKHKRHKKSKKSKKHGKHHKKHKRSKKSKKRKQEPDVVDLVDDSDAGDDFNNDGGEDADGAKDENQQGAVCPICKKAIAGAQDGSAALNKHIDRCLLRTAGGDVSAANPTGVKKEKKQKHRQRRKHDDEENEFDEDDAEGEEEEEEELGDIETSEESDLSEEEEDREGEGEGEGEGETSSDPPAADSIAADTRSYARARASLHDDDRVERTFRERVREHKRQMRERADGNEEVTMAGGLKIPKYLAEPLYRYQRTGLKWLWQLHAQNAGGIIGDEMGLGKTIQVIALLGALHHSKMLHSVLVLVPATVLQHWLREFHRWYPPLRVILCHSSGNRKARGNVGGVFGRAAELTRNQLVRLVAEKGGVLVTTYEAVRISPRAFLRHNWTYAVLDEGHKIRNPDAEVTLAVKQLQTSHRLILTGSPIQNNLRELWSLFDFVFPGRLGTLPTFEEEFVNPIRVGGYRNATALAAQLAYQCALVLRKLIAPYLLRRMKKDVQHTAALPKKTEQVLFCRLSDMQRQMYRNYISSEEVQSVIAGSMRSFRAIGVLQKICNHPDLAMQLPPPDFGAVERSAKLQVLQALLPKWHQAGHRVLIFCQTRQMLTIVQQYVEQSQWSYLRMDGNTTIRTRQAMVDQYNADSSIFLFLLTTRVGGIGISLTGADRVIIVDPNWNPSTDQQARERAWRVGQTREVTVYRLVVRGTIEEKIYQRQIFKQFLTNKVLVDAKLRRFFNSDQLRDLFSLDESADGWGDTESTFVDGVVRRSGASGGAGGTSSAGSGIGSGRGRKQGKKSRVYEEEQRFVTGDGSDSDGSDGVDGVGSGAGLERAAAGDEGEQTNGEEAAQSRRRLDNVRATQGDDDLLDMLMGNDGVCSVFSHDTVEKSAAGGGGQDHALLQLEASRIARHAADALRRSRDAVAAAQITRSNGPSHAPTWTGRAGVAGAPGRRHQRFGSQRSSQQSGGAGASSNSLLATMRNRQTPMMSSARAGVAGAGAGAGASASVRSVKTESKAGAKGAQGSEGAESAGSGGAVSLGERILRMLTAAGDDGVPTQAFLDTFDVEVKGEDSYIFRDLLRELGCMERGVWKLKQQQ